MISNPRRFTGNPSGTRSGDCVESSPEKHRPLKQKNPTY